MRSLAALAAVAFLSAPAPVSAERRILIGIVPHAEQISFTCESRCALRDAGGKKLDLLAGKIFQMESAGSAVRFRDHVLAGEVRVEPVKDGAVRLGGKRYHGCLRVKPDGQGRLTAVCELGIEEYLLGVLPHEMDPNWPIEALKAQAVVARTFAYTQMGKFREAGFDLTNDTRSQMYGGIGSEWPSIRAAVAQTRGEVLGYGGKIIDVFYHSCCGGHTASAESVWGGKSPPPLRGVRDKWCDASPYRRWTVFFGFDELVGALQQSLSAIGNLRRFDIGKRDRYGWVRTFRVKVGDKSGELRAAELRAALGNTELRSTRITRLRKLKKGIEFIGSGSGHGVGLCQWGARLQAQKGRRYEKILQHYFPGAELSVVDE